MMGSKIFTQSQRLIVIITDYLIITPEKKFYFKKEPTDTF